MFGYRQLFRALGDVLAFGFVLNLLAAFGKTWFVDLFSTEVRAAFGLSHSGFGAIFSVATLTSGLLLIWLGGLIDRMPPGAYARPSPCWASPRPRSCSRWPRTS